MSWKRSLIDQFAFYEQGISYSCSFRKEASVVYLDFVDPDTPGSDSTGKGKLSLLGESLFAFYEKVVSLSRMFCPELYDNEVYVDWRKGIDAALMKFNYLKQ